MSTILGITHPAMPLVMVLALKPSQALYYRSTCALGLHWRAPFDLQARALESNSSNCLMLKELNRNGAVFILRLGIHFVRGR